MTSTIPDLADITRQVGREHPHNVSLKPSVITK